MKEYSCDYRVYTREIYIIRGKLKNFEVQLLRSNALFLCWHEDTNSLRLFSDERSGRQIIRNFSFKQRLYLLLEFTLWERYRNIALTKVIFNISPNLFWNRYFKVLESRPSFVLFREMYEIGCTLWDRYKNLALARALRPQIAKLCQNSTTRISILVWDIIVFVA